MVKTVYSSSILNQQVGTFFGTPYNIQSVTNNSTGKDNLFLGIDNAYFRDQIANRQEAGTGASGVKYRIIDRQPLSATYGYAVNNYPYNDTRYIRASGFPYGDFPGGTVVSPSDNQFVENLAIGKFINQCIKAQTSFMAGQNLGEWKRTRDSLTRPASSLRSYVLGYFDGLRRQSPRLRRIRKQAGNRGLNKALADTYLEWNFGIAPIIRDVNSALHTFQLYRIPVQRIGVREVVNLSGRSDYWSPETTLTISGSRQSTVDIGCGIRGAVECNTNASGRASVSQELQLLPRDFVPTVYELIPYTFVIDYFTNLGDIVKAVCFASADIVYCSMIHWQTDEVSYTCHKVENDVNGIQTLLERNLSGGTLTLQRKSFERSVVPPARLIPGLTFSLPEGNKPWVNMGALILSRGRSLTKLLLG
jgi:hypothetical protein